MNVLLVVPWDQEFGGVASVVANLANRLEASGDRVVFVHPGRPNAAKRRSTARGFDGYEMNLRPPLVPRRPVRSAVAFVLWLGFTLFELASIIRRHRIHVVNIHYPVDEFVYFALLRRLLPIKLVVSVHGAELFPNGRRTNRYSWATKFLLSAADTLVAPSASFLADCISLFPRTAEKAVAIHNGIDLAELEPTEPAISGTQRPPYLLCIAAHNEKKALDVLLRAFAQLGSAHDALVLVLVGEGPLFSRHKELARSLGIEQRVEFLGPHGRADIGRLLHDCLMFVLPSRSEPFGMVLAEAMACRKPVIASAAGGIPEIVDNGHSGLLVEPDNPEALAKAVLSVLEDPKLREALSEAGYRVVRARFGSDTMGNRYKALYAGLANAVAR